MRGLMARLRHDDRGLSAMEFALILPILVMFSAGTIEYSRLILITQKVQSGAFNLADLTARDKELTDARMANIFLSIEHVVKPFDFETNGRAIVTNIGADDDDNPILTWQCNGAGFFAVGSLIGSEPGADVALPAGLEVRHGETMIAAELFYDFQPLFGIGLGPQVIRRAAYFKPRLGELDIKPCD